MTQRLEDIEAPLITTYRTIVQDETVDTADHYYGMYNEQVKSAGATGAGDDFFGLYNITEMDQVGGTVRYLDGIVNELVFTAGTVTDLDVFYSYINADAGTVGGQIYGGHIVLDIEAGVSVAGDIYGLYVDVDTATVPTGDTFMVYLDEVAGVDYGFYQNGIAHNYLGGILELDKSINWGTLALSAVGPTDDLDVTDVNTVFVDTGSNNVTLGGTVGGVNGQILLVLVHDPTNNFIIEDHEGTGNQDFYLHAGADEQMTGEYGGWIFINMAGNHWHDASHAKHV
jgi:hypothetical protein